MIHIPITRSTLEALDRATFYARDIHNNYVYVKRELVTDEQERHVGLILDDKTVYWCDEPVFASVALNLLRYISIPNSVVQELAKMRAKHGLQPT